MNMKKKEFALFLYNKLRKGCNTQEIAQELNSAKIAGRPLNEREKIEIVELIKEIHNGQSKGIFESVDAFLALINNVEKAVKAQNSASSEDKEVKSSNGNE